MPMFVVTKQVSVPDARYDNLGTRMDVSVGVSTSAVSFDGSSSSSSRTISVPELTSSSSSAVPSTDYDSLFLYRRKDGRDFFLGVCSPADIETWPVNSPGTGDGYFRRSSVAMTFRAGEIMDDTWEALWSHISELARALTILASLRDQEVVTYDFPQDDAHLNSSSSASGMRSFTLTRDALVPYPTTDPKGYRLRVVCTSEGTDKNIFLLRDDLADRSGDVHTRPIAVCSPGDLVDYPDTAPDDDQFPAHYRSDTFDVVSSRVELLQEGWNNIKHEVARLAAVLKIHTDEVTSVTSHEAEYNA